MKIWVNCNEELIKWRNRSNQDEFVPCWVFPGQKWGRAIPKSTQNSSKPCPQPQRKHGTWRRRTARTPRGWWTTCWSIAGNAKINPLWWWCLTAEPGTPRSPKLTHSRPKLASVNVHIFFAHGVGHLFHRVARSWSWLSDYTAQKQMVPVFHFRKRTLTLKNGGPSKLIFLNYQSRKNVETGHHCNKPSCVFLTTASLDNQTQAQKKKLSVSWSSRRWERHSNCTEQLPEMARDKWLRERKECMETRRGLERNDYTEASVQEGNKKKSINTKQYRKENSIELMKNHNFVHLRPTLGSQKIVELTIDPKSKAKNGPSRQCVIACFNVKPMTSQLVRHRSGNFNTINSKF